MAGIERTPFYSTHLSHLIDHNCNCQLHYIILLCTLSLQLTILHACKIASHDKYPLPIFMNGKQILFIDIRPDYKKMCSFLQDLNCVALKCMYLCYMQNKYHIPLSRSLNCITFRYEQLALKMNTCTQASDSLFTFIKSNCSKLKFFAKTEWTQTCSVHYTILMMRQAGGLRCNGIEWVVNLRLLKWWPWWWWDDEILFFKRITTVAAIVTLFWHE